MVDMQVLRAQLNTHDSFYLYEEAGIRAAARRLQSALSGARLLYSMKCNPAGRVLDTVFKEGFGADAASVGEVGLAEAHGVPAGQIYFSAPARTEADLRRAYGRCVLIADSLREVELIARIAAEKGETAEIGLRLNPDFTFAADHGVPGKFGVDEETFFAECGRLATLPGVKIVGIHVHAKSQELSAAVLSGYYRNLFRLVGRVTEKLPLRFANFGSGLGIPFAPGEAPLALEELGEAFRAMLAECRKAWPALEILIESGRYVVGKSGTYVTKVLEKKCSRGKTFLLLHDTLNGFARPAVGEMVRGFTDAPFPCEPVFTHVDAQELIPLTGETALETVTLAGNLCTSADIIARDVRLPRMEVGDGLAMTNAGCYAAVMTPMQFAAMTPPAQLFLEAGGKITDA